jgi:hypothetical protein
LDIAKNYNLECYTHAYGAEDFTDIGQMGLKAMNRWTHGLQNHLKHYAGHADFFAHLKTAAFTQNTKGTGDIAFTPAGLNPAYTLNLQHDLLCWPDSDIETLTSFQPFVRIVRGQSFKAAPPEINRFVLTLDDGASMNEGSLYAACLDPQGRILEWLDF